MPDLLHLSLTSVLWQYVFWSASLSFFPFLTQPPSPSRSLINSTGLPSDAFQAHPSFHRLGRGRRPEGYWLNRLKLGEKIELSLLKIKTLLPPRIVDRVSKSLWTSEEQKWFDFLAKDIVPFKTRSWLGKQNPFQSCTLGQNKQRRTLWTLTRCGCILSWMQRPRFNLV